MIDTKKHRDFNFVIFAVAQSVCSQSQNAELSRDIEEHMEERGIPFNKCIGSYKGQLENSYIISEDNFNELRDVIFDQYNQESVLFVETDNTAHLLYAGGNVQMLGKLEKTGIQNAIDNEEAFTIKGNHAYVVE